MPETRFGPRVGSARSVPESGRSGIATVPERSSVTFDPAGGPAVFCAASMHAEAEVCGIRCNLRYFEDLNHHSERRSIRSPVQRRAGPAATRLASHSPKSVRRQALSQCSHGTPMDQRQNAGREKGLPCSWRDIRQVIAASNGNTVQIYDMTGKNCHLKRSGHRVVLRNLIR